MLTSCDIKQQIESVLVMIFNTRTETSPLGRHVAPL